MQTKIDVWPGARRRMLREKKGEPRNRNEEEKQNVLQADVIRRTWTVKKRIKRSIREAVVTDQKANYLVPSYICL